jgi:hypothetical protein
VTIEILLGRQKFQEIRQRPIEIPCKDLDVDCLPDEEGDVPFGNYTCCYFYDKEQGMCPFLPFHRSNSNKRRA